ncbi:heme peroxidase [Mycena sp. CBHHK59/15]|nr:heme peroxidase [Mycena sp. CBHHK59/15]
MFHLTLLTFLATANAYVWPSPQLDALESARFDQIGFNAADGALAGFIEPCDSFLFGINTGRSNAADWIRTAYHDMATHNVTDGTGGLDASIRFAEEQARPENAGDGFRNTFLIVFLQVNRYVSIADSLALAAIIAIENWLQAAVPKSPSGADALTPESPTYQVSLNRRKTWTRTSPPSPAKDSGRLNDQPRRVRVRNVSKKCPPHLTIARHTFGGVQHDPFPDIVGALDDPNNTEEVAHFDSTFVTFDNNIATEYISGTTQNPLVVGFNDTTNSDQRIFGSDGNVTMLSFAKSPKLFASTCADLFARMLNTVPSGVQLTDVITPLPVKPANVELLLDGDTLKLSGQVRFWNMKEDATRTVRMLWHDHVGGTNNVTLGFVAMSSSTGGRYSAAWYGFKAGFLSLDPAAGIKSMGFVVDGKLEDQGGVGFAVQDGVIFSETSCQSRSAGRLDVAVRNGLNPTRVYLEHVTSDSVGRLVIVEIDIAPPAQPIAANSVYSMWSMNLTDPIALYSIGAEINGVKFSTTDQHSFIDFPLCPT